MFVYELERFHPKEKVWYTELAFYMGKVENLGGCETQKPLRLLGQYNGTFPIKYPFIVGDRVISENEYRKSNEE